MDSIAARTRTHHRSYSRMVGVNGITSSALQAAVASGRLAAAACQQEISLLDVVLQVLAALADQTSSTSHMLND